AASIRPALFLGRNSHRLDAGEYGLGLQDHAFTSAKRTVIHRFVPVRGKVPQIMDRNFNQSGFTRPAHDAEIQRATEKVRKNRYDLELHQWTHNCSGPGPRFFNCKASCFSEESRSSSPSGSFILTCFCSSSISSI